MTHTILVSYDYDEATGEFVPVYDEIFVTGLPITNYYFNVFSLYTGNIWDPYYDENSNPIENRIPVYTYLFNGPGVSGVNHIAESESSIHGLPGGFLSLKGEFVSVEVYDIKGQKVFSTSNPAPIVETGLDNGIYIINARTTEGVVKTLKLIF